MSDFLSDLKGQASEAYDVVESGASNAKRSFGRALVDATNLQPADMRKLPAMRESQNELREYGAEAADLLLPGTTDALPIGKMLKGAGAVLKLGKTFGNVVKEIKAANAVGNTIKELSVKSANLPEMTKKGYELLDDTYKATRAPASFGKVMVKESAPIKYGKIVVKDK